MSPLVIGKGDKQREAIFIAYLPRDKKGIEALEEIPKYLEKEEFHLFLNMAKEKGLEMDYVTFLILSYTE